MAAETIDGKGIAALVRAEVGVAAQRLTAAGQRPGLTVVLVGEDPASQVYVRNKDRAADRAGFRVETRKLPAQTPQAELLALVAELNADEAVHGILVQLPLPGGLDADAVVRAIDPAKDVDGLHPDNVAALWMGTPGHRPCTPSGCVELLDRTGIDIAGRNAVVIGRSLLVGKPLAALLLARNATVTIAHSRTADLAGLARGADILVAAVGRAELVRGNWIKPGAAVLDVGINRGADGSLVGDVAFDEARERAAAITPVPGGVGPMTIAMLLRNTAAAAARRAGLDAEQVFAEARLIAAERSASAAGSGLAR
ncbi:Tetrahydrofolate dehydrogenase/cyclohydrolase [Planctomycetes bacterium Pla86]|uniref:Bifunctional protein FolD n=1 Tax=Engelhardtia mirabilis TaxID=2528011 RepID=A0A518BJN7_9BACT|nr:Tetrahydrofolate dehydrogenase/cyclohydrolase [Planctomycetes bacterium Pla133]QDV01513.1 Tetrahydrofolate dehydrogenase/cyclohydrolase [Planctomycetes bacterium Pla86]